MIDKKIKIGYLGVGRYLPSNILTNERLEELVETSDDWIVQRTGIKQRRIMGPDESLLSMATAAAREAISKAGIEASQITDIHIGVNTHNRFPSLAAMVQQELGIDQASSCDLSAGCSAFIFCVDAVYNKMMAEWLLEGKTTYALAIGVDGLSRITDYSDRKTCVLFGDGAGAVVIGPVDSGGILATTTRTQGQYADLLYLPEVLENPLKDPAKMVFDMKREVRAPFIFMEGRKVFPVAVRSMMADIRSVIDKYNRMNGERVSLDDIEYVIPHQANHRIVSAVGEGLKLSGDQVYLDGVINYGNTSAASIPIGYVDTFGNRPGALEVDVAFGAGFASGAILRRNPA